MPRFLDTHGNSTLSIFVCDRCHMKRPYSDMRPDGNIPALKVCSDSCSDQFDPYRLPARQPDKITIRFPRPDADIAVHPDAIITDGGAWNPISPEAAPEHPNDGNLDNLSP